MMRAVLMSILLFALLAAPSPASAEPSVDNAIDFPLPADGLFDMPGNVTWMDDIVSFWWLVPMVFLSGAILWTIKWIDGDARHLKIDPVPWNITGIALALASLVAFFMLWAWLSLPLVAAAFAIVLGNYLPTRNARVIPERRLLTPDHRQALKTRFFKWLGIHPSGGVEKRLEKIARTHLPVEVFDGRGRLVVPADAPFDPDDPMTVVRDVLGEAVRRNAREIEFAAKGMGLSVSFVIDGLMYSGTTLDRVHGNAATAVMKRSLVDPSSATPQFRIQLPTLKRTMTVQPFVWGEGDAELMRLRLTSDREEMRRFADLGLTDPQAAAMRSALDTGRGLIVVASPPAMGARTTLCAFVDTFDPFSRSVVTFERPISTKLSSIEQHEFADAAALAELLHEALDKDPDVVMLSELPDAATASTALGAARNEQLFLARLELPAVAAVPGYLAGCGVPAEAVAAGLHTLVAQRLVRTLCRSCRRKVDPPAAVLQRIGVDPSRVEFLYEETTGCDACGHTGFHGRTGIFEVWSPSVESRRRIEQGASAEALHAAAVKDGMTPLQNSGLKLVIEGVTSLHELARVLKGARVS